MRTWKPKCPRCCGTEHKECCSEEDGGADGILRVTHECQRCKTRFRVVPPEAFLLKSAPPY